MPSFVIYARKSTESEDRQVLSIDSQVRELKLLAARRGLEIEEVLQESRSAKAPGRPVFGELMRRVRKRTIAGVLCWKIDRLARNHADSGQVLQALADGTLPRIVTPERDYTGDGTDRLMGGIEFGFSTNYIDQLRANVTRGNRERLRRGWPNFRPPQGYLEDHTTKTVLKDPVRFVLVHRMWDLLLSGGLRPRQILEEANERWGYRTPKEMRRGDRPLSLTGLYGIFGNPYYVGLIRVKGELHKGGHEPMVSPEEFERAQQILGRPGRPRPIRREFAYAGLLRCGRCGGAMVGEEHVKASGRRYVYYRCHGRRSVAACPEPSLPEGRLDQQLHEDLGRMLLPPRALRWIGRRLEISVSADFGQRQAARESLGRALRQARLEGETLLTLRLRGQVSEEVFESRQQEIAARQAKLALQLEQPALAPEELLERVERALAFPRVAQDLLQSGDVVGRRQIVQAIGSNWRVQERKALYTAKKPFSIIGGKGASSLWWTIADSNR